MKRLILACAVALALPACAGLPTPSINAPAPLVQTEADEKALLAAYSAFDLALTAIDGLKAVGVLVPGTPKALKVQGFIRTAQDGLNAARDLRTAGSTADYIAALQSAESALRLIGVELKKGN